jgi:hypothetical protein
VRIVRCDAPAEVLPAFAPLKHVVPQGVKR